MHLYIALPAEKESAVGGPGFHGGIPAIVFYRGVSEKYPLA